MITAHGVPFRVATGPKNIAFTSRWDNWPTSVEVPIGPAGRTAWCLIAGTTSHMQTGVANAVVEVRCEEAIERYDLVHPRTFWSLSGEYDYALDGFCLPSPPPLTVCLGTNCRGVVVPVRLDVGRGIRSIRLQTLSPEVVVGIMAITIARE